MVSIFQKDSLYLTIENFYICKFVSRLVKRVKMAKRHIFNYTKQSNLYYQKIETSQIDKQFK